MDSSFCRSCGVALTQMNRFTCSLKYKCKFGKCSNKYTCRRKDLCIQCQSGEIKSAETDHFADDIQEAMEAAASHSSLSSAHRATIVAETCSAHQSSEVVYSTTLDTPADPVHRKRTHESDDYERTTKKSTASQEFCGTDETSNHDITTGTTDSESPFQLNSSASISVHNFFRLKDRPEFFESISAGVESSRRWAWLGDSIIEAHVAQHVYECRTTATIGELTLHKARYVCNSTMATFLQVATDAAAHMEEGLSEYNMGVMFQALVGATALVHGNATAHDVVRQYILYVDTAADKFSFPIGATAPLTIWTYSRDPASMQHTSATADEGSIPTAVTSSSTNPRFTNGGLAVATTPAAVGELLPTSNHDSMTVAATVRTPDPVTNSTNEYRQILRTVYGSVSRSSCEIATKPLVDVVRAIPEYCDSILTPVPTAATTEAGMHRPCVMKASQPTTTASPVTTVQ
eukprot:m.489303 g.489303  ORF g.489303 m.489303 type:complete len:461 (-) comp21764_c0_seq5:339-1721(-)